MDQTLRNMGSQDRPARRGKVQAIVIGASAGGVEALMALLPALPADLAAPVFVVLHLPRDRDSLLVDIFRPRCALAVEEAQDKVVAAEGTVYFAPPDYHLLLDAVSGDTVHMSLSVDDAVNYSRPSIDVLFESAADAYRGRLMGIVLTGGNHDGSDGLDAVRRAGGVTVVQNPAGAQVSLMPASALARGPVDLVLSLDDMAGLLNLLREHAA
ncbi:MAG: chemotaxis protein CheB [Rhodoferax sp.]|nr:chemotaxis protein CheB [Rhodoferax sp.]